MSARESEASRRERYLRELARAGREPREPAACGTYAGYKRHLKRREETCAPCRRANTEYVLQQERKRRKAEKASAEPKRRKVAECGTVGGYNRHRRTLKEDPCEACMEAANAAARARYAKKRATAGQAVRSRTVAPAPEAVPTPVLPPLHLGPLATNVPLEQLHRFVSDRARGYYALGACARRARLTPAAAQALAGELGGDLGQLERLARDLRAHLAAAQQRTAA